VGGWAADACTFACACMLANAGIGNWVNSLNCPLPPLHTQQHSPPMSPCLSAKARGRVGCVHICERGRGSAAATAQPESPSHPSPLVQQHNPDNPPMRCCLSAWPTTASGSRLSVGTIQPIACSPHACSTSASTCATSGTRASGSTPATPARSSLVRVRVRVGVRIKVRVRVRVRIRVRVRVGVRASPPKAACACNISRCREWPGVYVGAQHFVGVHQYLYLLGTARLPRPPGAACIFLFCIECGATRSHFCTHTHTHTHTQPHTHAATATHT